MKQYPPIEIPEVSVVIPVYNEESCIGECIISLLAQDFVKVEIVVVDDGSTDASAALAASLGAVVLKGAHKGPGAARNAGARAASGNILVLVDADMTFAPDYVSRLVLPIVKGGAAATCHWNEMVANWDNPWARCQTWFLGSPDGRRQPAEAPEKENVYRAVRKDFFLTSGGFAEDEGRGDDASVSRRTGVFAVIVPDAGCFHRNATGPGEVFEDALWRGRDMAAAKERRLARCAAAFFLYHNPIPVLFRGLRLGLLKKEPRLPVYSLVFSAGFLSGLVLALITGQYQK